MDTTITVTAEETQPVPLSVGDTARLVRWKGRFLRGVPTARVPEFRRLFDGGLVTALVERGLLVRSWISPVRLEGFELVVEHEPIDAPTYPREWSFGMLRDAALLVVEVNETASRHGFQTRDCHGYNILFHHGRPIFVDLGSFVPVITGEPVMFAYDEFLRSYEYPLRIWSRGGADLGRRTVPRVGSILPSSSYWRFRCPPARWLGDATLERWLGRVHSLRTLVHRRDEEIAARHAGRRASLLRRLRAGGWGSGPARLAAIRRRLLALRPPRDASAWSDYQAAMGGNEPESLTPRFRAVLERLRSLGARSMLEIAGNQGVLSRAAAADGAMRVICTDADAGAVDRGYREATRGPREPRAPLDWAVFDPFRHETSPQESPPTERFRADAVVALAVTHHLVLTQGLDLGAVLDAIGSFAERFVLVEFMPRGLWTETGSVPVPAWYSERWFRDAFERRFDLLERADLETNRVLFVGRVRGRER